MTRRTILGVFAHPDDESMGPGGTFAKYAAAGHRVAVVTATDGGAGRLFAERPKDEAERDELRRLRRLETVDACRILGIEHLGFFGWEDGALAARNVLEVDERIAAVLRRERPDVVVTFHGSGISYHPDHRVIWLALVGAFCGAALPDWYADGEASKLAPHRTAKLYGYAVSRSAIPEAWPRKVYLADSDEITARIDTHAWMDKRWEAIRAHATQQNGPPFQMLYEHGAFASESFVRVFPSPVAGDPQETDLLAGL